MTNLIKIMYYMFILVLAQEFPPNLSILKVYQNRSVRLHFHYTNPCIKSCVKPKSLWKFKTTLSNFNYNLVKNSIIVHGELSGKLKSKLILFLKDFSLLECEIFFSLSGNLMYFISHIKNKTLIFFAETIRPSDQTLIFACRTFLRFMISKRQKTITRLEYSSHSFESWNWN